MNTSLIKILKTIAMLLIMALSFSACNKDAVTRYELEDVNLYSSASDKKNLKSDEQFISIMYTDIFERSISNSQLVTMNEAYTSMGDKSLIIDILIKSLLTDQGASIPTLSEMKSKPEEFVQNTYTRFLVRLPSKQEEWFLVNQIESNNKLEPIDIYYAMLTSEEYRYY